MAGACFSQRKTPHSEKNKVYTVNVTELILNAVALGLLVLEHGMEMDLKASYRLKSHRRYPQIMQVVDDHDLVLKPVVTW